MEQADLFFSLSIQTHDNPTRVGTPRWRPSPTVLLLRQTWRCCYLILSKCFWLTFLLSYSLLVPFKRHNSTEVFHQRTRCACFACRWKQTDSVRVVHQQSPGCLGVVGGTFRLPQEAGWILRAVEPRQSVWVASSTTVRQQRRPERHSLNKLIRLPCFQS